MPAIFVAGAGTDVGKTYVTAVLITALRDAGRSVEALKPVVSGFDPAAPAGSDPAVLLAALGRTFDPASLDAMAPWRYRAPLSPPTAAAREGARLDGAAVAGWCRRRLAEAPSGSWTFVESAGGIMSPLDDQRTMLDLAAELALPVLLVTGSYLGTLSHTLTAAAVIKAAGLRLAAVAISEGEEGVGLTDTVEELARRLPYAPVIGIGRRQASPAALAAALGAMSGDLLALDDPARVDAQAAVGS